MRDTVTIPGAEHDHLCAAEDDFVDLQAALAAALGVTVDDLLPA